MLSITQKFILRPFINSWKDQNQLILSRNYAARKGTRDRKNKKKVKVVVEKVGFIPHNQRNREKFLASRAPLKFNDSWKMDPVDEVYRTKYYKSKIYPFIEAVECHRETHHPEVYNLPNAPLKAVIELNMQGEKKTKFIENFNRICEMPFPFSHGEERTIIVFAKDVDEQKLALDAGAQLSGGVELIKNIQNGKVSLQDFEFVISHPDILHELSSLRGLMKKKYPNMKMGTLTEDLPGVVNRYLTGINYTAIKDEYEKDFGKIETPVGTLDMDPSNLEKNFEALLKDVMVVKPKRSEDFIRRTLLVTPPSGEQFTIDHRVYIREENVQKKDEDNEEVEEVDQRVVL